MFASKNFFLAGAPGFTPGNQTFTSSGTFAIPVGTTTLQIEVWGGGGSGGSGAYTASNPPGTNNTSGGASSCNGLTANGGTKANQSPGGAGGSASGGTTNTTGTSGVGIGAPYSRPNCSPPSSKEYWPQGGPGGAGANGGSGGLGSCDLNAFGNAPAGNASGGGGAGATGIGGSGGGGGGAGYSTKTFTGLSGSLSYTVGATGIGGTATPGPGGKGPQFYGIVNGGSGGSGAVKFTWS